MNEHDLNHCRDAIKTGSYSFYAASRLLPARVRDPALALYAFCRFADDAVDLVEEKAAAVLRLQERLDAAYAGRPRNTPVDRAFTAMIDTHQMPKALPEALLEGFAWDAQGRVYPTLSGVRAYSARVAAAVGAMMTVLMGVRDPHALARACDLGVAMQLTNIARDIGEDARARRIYLPTDWMADAGIEIEAFYHDPLPIPKVRRMTKRLLAEAQRLYLRSEAGVKALPLPCRPGIMAARLIYGGIGGAVRGHGYDSVSRRASTTSAQKIGWLAQATVRVAGGAVMPQSSVLYAPPLPEVQFLVDAAADTAPQTGWGGGRTGAILEVLADLKGREAARLTKARARPT